MRNCAVCHKPVTSGIVVHSECMELLQKTQQLDNKPLTIDELRRIYDGEKGAVWVQFGEAILPAILDYYNGDLVAVWSANGHEDGLWEKDYGKTWVAYRRKPNDWISVKKRPPEYDAPVWGWDAQCHCAKEVNYINGEFFDVFGEDAYITHWMPLPEPPEVE